MALIKCPECGTKISDSAAACVKCGCQVKEFAGKAADSKKPGKAAKSEERKAAKAAESERKKAAKAAKAASKAAKSEPKAAKSEERKDAKKSAKKKSGGKAALIVVAVLIAAVLTAAALTNPNGWAEHQRAVASYYSVDDVNFLTSVIGGDIENCVFFTLTKVRITGTDEIIGIGAFGKVWLFADKSPTASKIGEVQRVFATFQALLMAAMAEKGGYAGVTESDLEMFTPPADSKWWTYTVEPGFQLMAASKVPFGKINAGATLAMVYNPVWDCFYVNGNNALMILGGYHQANVNCSRPDYGDQSDGDEIDHGSDGGFATGAFTDPRDSQTYSLVRIGGVIWMADNLNYVTQDSWCYDDDNENCTQHGYGRLYSWEAATGACPDGWHLPSDQEWGELINTVGDTFDAGRKLKSATGWANNGNGADEFGFSAMPGGSRTSAGSFVSNTEFGRWWTATVANDDAYRRDMGAGSSGVSGYLSKKSNGYSVRCVENQ